MIKFPCENCITLGVCKSRYRSPIDVNKSSYSAFLIMQERRIAVHTYLLTSKCSLINDYVFSDIYGLTERCEFLHSFMMEGLKPCHCPVKLVSYLLYAEPDMRDTPP